MSDAGPDDRALRPLVGGRLLAEITNRIVAFMREHYGRGPIKAKTYVLDNLIVCVLTDGFTAIERTMMEGGEPDRVLEMRRDFQRMMKQRYTAMIQELTGRTVLAFLSQAHVEPDLTIEIFLMDGPLAGFGALELVDPPPNDPHGERRLTNAPAPRSATSSAAACARHRAERTECQRRQTRTHAPASAQRRRPRGSARAPYPAGRLLLSQQARVRARPPLARLSPRRLPRACVAERSAGRSLSSISPPRGA